MADAPEMKKLKDEISLTKFKKNFKFLNKDQKAEVMAFVEGKMPEAEKVVDSQPPVEEHKTSPAHAQPAAAHIVPAVERQKERGVREAIMEDRYPEGTILAIFVCKENHKTKATVMDKNVKCRVCERSTIMKCYYNAKGSTVPVPAGIGA